MAIYQGEEDTEEPPPNEQSRDNEGYDNKGIDKGFYGNDELLYYYPRDDQDQQEAEAHFVTPTIAKAIIYRRCRKSFSSKNLLYKYLRDDRYTAIYPSKFDKKAYKPCEAYMYIAYSTKIIKLSASDRSEQSVNTEMP